MSLDTARQAVDLAFELGKDSACVSFFGGEPLLEWPLILQIIDYAKQQSRKVGKHIVFRMSTNGTLFTEEMLQVCKENRVLFAISLDGNEQAHNAQRLTAQGTGSFKLVDEKLEMMLRYNPLTVATSVITPQTVDRLADSIHYIWSRGLRYIVHQLDYTHPDWTPKVMEQLSKSYEQLALWYIERMRAGDAFYMNLFDDKLRTHIRTPIKLGVLCDFGAKKISIAQDGTIYPCVQFVSDREDTTDFRIGHVSSGLTPRWQELIAANKQERTDCKGCALLGRCSNYCGCLNWQTTGSVTGVSPILCAHEQMLIPIADEIGNILFKEKNPMFIRKHYKHLKETDFVHDFD